MNHGGTIAMAGKLLPDELWDEIEGLFPVYQPSPDGGRPPKEARTVLTAMLFVLKTGIGWEDLPHKAFDCKSLRQLLRWLGIKPLIPHRGQSESGLGTTRWFIERTLSWLHQFRRLRTRWDRNPLVHQAFLSLAAAVICYRTWINES